MTFLDVDINYRLTLRNGVLVYRKVPADAATAQATRASWRTSCGCLALAAGDDDFAWLGDRPAMPTCCRRSLGGAGPAGPGLQHRHAVATLRLQYRGTSNGPSKPGRARHTAGIALSTGIADSVSPPVPKLSSTV